MYVSAPDYNLAGGAVQFALNPAVGKLQILGHIKKARVLCSLLLDTKLQSLLANNITTINLKKNQQKTKQKNKTQMQTLISSTFQKTTFIL